MLDCARQEFGAMRPGNLLRKAMTLSQHGVVSAQSNM